jgi:hypothetical protein
MCSRVVFMAVISAQAEIQKMDARVAGHDVISF